MARRATKALSGGKKCCVKDARGRTVACFTGEGASTKAAALQRIVKKSKTSSSCALTPRSRR